MEHSLVGMPASCWPLHERKLNGGEHRNAAEFVDPGPCAARDAPTCRTPAGAAVGAGWPAIEPGS
jgi:hypothetical protein